MEGAKIVFSTIFTTILLLTLLHYIPPISAYISSVLPFEVYQEGETAPVDGETCILKAAVPLMGYLKCDVVAPDVETVDTVFEGDTITTNFNTPKIKAVKVACPEDFTYFRFKSSVTEACPLGGETWCESPVAGHGTYTTIFTDVPNFRLTGYCLKKKWMGLKEEKTTAKLKFVYDAYGLVAISPTWGRQIVAANTCDLKYADKSRIPKDVTQTRVNYGESINYLVAWVEGPYELNVHRWNGRDVFCMDTGAIYSIGKFRAKDGNCYAYPNKIIAYEDCCPGQQAANLICDEDFKWKPLQTNKCQTDADCKEGYKCIMGTCTKVVECFSTMECPGAGDWIVDTSDPTRRSVVKYECRDHSCVIVDRKTGQCTPPNIGCPNGQVCILDRTTGMTYCKPSQATGGYCGDGVCQSWENAESCPQDCAMPIPSPANLKWIWIPYFALLGAMVQYAKRRDVIDASIGGMVGMLVGYGVYWFLSLPTIAKILAVGGGIALVTGLIYLLFFTGFGATLLLLLSLARRPSK